MFIYTVLLVLSQCYSVLGWKLISSLSKRYHAVSKVVRMSSTTEDVAVTSPPSSFPEPNFKSISVSGFSSQANNFADDFVVSKIFKKDFTESIKLITDNIKFAKKRFVKPETVYSGLADCIKYEEAELSDDSIANAINGSDAWVAYNISSTELPIYASAAVKAAVKRVVFGVNVSSAERGADVTFPAICEQLTAAGVLYTIVKYGEVRKMGEGKYPYRIVRGVLPLPELNPANSVVGTFDLSSQDLYRILLEAVDLPKTYNNVYGVGAGTSLDTEILIYMKSQGWPERVQVGLLMGDMMEKIEKKYEAYQAAQKRAAASPPKPSPSSSLLPETGKPLDKYAGFFSG